jgi:pyruvate-ferredoxin/flavodoxin oxidoreductase
MRFGAEQQKLAVNSGVWPLYRYDPRRIERGEPPLVIDVMPGRSPVEEYMRNEARFRMVEAIDPERFRRLAVRARLESARRVSLYEQLAHITFQGADKTDPQAAGAPSKAREIVK